MGTSYETVLVVAEPPTVVAALTADGVVAWVGPAGEGRTAVVPREDRLGNAHSAELAASLSTAGLPALSSFVFDSDVVMMQAYREGQLAHHYFADATRTDGPDAEILARYGVGEIDLDRLGALLRGERDDEDRVLRERQHLRILEALNLDPTWLTTAYRWINAEETPGGVLVEPTCGSWDPVGIIVFVPLPVEADDRAIGQLLADAAAELTWPVRADVAYVPTIPDAAVASLQRLVATVQLEASPRVQVYFVNLHVKPGLGQPSDTAMVSTLNGLWSARLGSDLKPVAKAMPNEDYQVIANAWTAANTEKLSTQLDPNGWLGLD